MATFALRVEKCRGALLDFFTSLGKTAGLERLRNHRNASVALTIEAGTADTLVLVHGAGATRTFVEQVAVELATSGARVYLISTHVPEGGRGRNVTATGAVYEGTTITPDEDAQEDAVEIVSDWKQEGTLFDEYEAELELARELADAGAGKRTSIEAWFKPACGARLAPFFAAIADGIPVELVTLNSSRAAKVRMPDGSMRMAVLNDAELAQIELALAEKR